MDESKDLEAYIYIPTERVSQLRQGLQVDLLDTNDNLLEKTKIDFISPQVDSSLQGILVKAPVQLAPEKLRNEQLVKARVVWSTAPTAVVPVLAVTRLGGQPFVFVAKQQDGHYIASQVSVTLGDTVGNSYAVTSGLSAGDRVIVSSTQFLVNGMPVMPLGGKAGALEAAHGYRRGLPRASRTASHQDDRKEGTHCLLIFSFIGRSSPPSARS